jgi:Phage integrase family
MLKDPFTGAIAGEPARGNAGWSSPVARQAHNLKVVGSNPAPATKFPLKNQRLNSSPDRRLDCFWPPASTWRVHGQRDRVRRPSFAGCALGSAGNRVAHAGARTSGCRFTVDPKSPWLFPSLGAFGPRSLTGRMNERSLTKAIVRFVNRLKLGHATPNSLRHTVGSHLDRLGFDLIEIGLVLGHKARGTTAGYAHYIDGRRSAVRRRPILMAWEQDLRRIISVAPCPILHSSESSAPLVFTPVKTQKIRVSSELQSD